MADLSPVVLVPGFTGTRLKSRGPDGMPVDLWLNPAAMTSEPTASPIKPSAWWLAQMSMAADGITPQQDPAFNRPHEGLSAISVLDPTPGHATDSRYFASLIDALRAAGYTDLNLKAAAYDWRASPGGLEQRFGYFTRLRATVAAMVAEAGRPATVLGHSLGNRVLQYFLEWVITADPNGRDWIEQHIERYIAVSSPWLGVPKSLREATTGAEGFGLIPIEGLRDVYQSYAALPWMIPVTPDQFRWFNTESFAYLDDDEHPLTIDATLTVGAPSTGRFLRSYYRADPLYTSPGAAVGDRAVRRPPVDRINVFHATGQDTEIGAYYHRSDSGLATDLSASTTDPEVVVRNGVRFESASCTVQRIDGTRDSGDGFVPYGSLRYFTRWGGTGVMGHALPGRTHYDVLSDPDFLERVVGLVTSQPPQQT